MHPDTFKPASQDSEDDEKDNNNKDNDDIQIIKMKNIFPRTAKHASTTLSNLLLKITASQELNGTQVGA